MQRRPWVEGRYQNPGRGSPPALAGKDIIGLAETGSGKTGAFAIPVLQALLESPARLFSLVLAPTRELAFQIRRAVRCSR